MRAISISKIKKKLINISLCGLMTVGPVLGYSALPNSAKTSINRGVANTLRNVADHIDPLKIIKNVDKSMNVQRYTEIRLSETQVNQITKLATSEIPTTSVVTYRKQDLDGSIFASIKNALVGEYIVIEAPVIAVTGYNQSYKSIISNAKIIVDNKKKVINVYLPNCPNKIEVLYVEPQFGGCKVIDKETGAFVGNLEEQKVFDILGTNQNNLKENLLNEKEILDKANKDASNALKDFFSIITTKGLAYEDFSINISGANTNKDTQ